MPGDSVIIQMKIQIEVALRSQASCAVFRRRIVYSGAGRFSEATTRLIKRRLSNWAMNSLMESRMFANSDRLGASYNIS